MNSPTPLPPHPDVNVLVLHKINYDTVLSDFLQDIAIDSDRKDHGKHFKGSMYS